MDLHGIINLHKPVAITSAKALYRVRRLTGQRKSGHAGTLDPAASGVLVLCLGRATQLVEAVMDQPKVYRATARMDVTSESYDSDRSLQHVEVNDPPSQEQVLAACADFEGVIEQVPPRISAIKIGGVPSYKRSAFDAVDLQPRRVRVYWLHVHHYAWPTIDFEMACGRGTYVRALIRDLGERLSTGGCLTSLIRSRVGPFVLSEASTFELIENANDATENLLDLDESRRRLDPASMEIPPRPSTSRGL